MANRQGYRPAASRQQATRTRTAQTRSRQAAPAKRKKKRKSHPLRIFLVLVLLAFVATAGVMGYLVYDEIDRVVKADTFYPGVYIDGVSLNGAKPQQAFEYLFERASAGLKDWAINLEYGGQTWTINSDTLGITSSLRSIVQDEVNKAFMIGRGPSLIENFRTVAALKTEPYQAYTTGIQKNTQPIDSIISEIQAAVYRAPVEATMSFDSTRKNDPIVVTPEQNGLELNAASLKETIISMVNNMEGGTIAIEPTQVPPTITASMLKGDLVLLGSYESPVSKNSTENRNMNIERGVQAFHGKVVKDGEKVSFNTWVGPRTAKNGFYEAAEIVSGAYEMGIGGGICQVSSALYNAVIQANLKVRSRTNHGIPVNYMPMGADATVSDGRIDFVFENNTGSSIYLVARLETRSSGKYCIFQIYGRPEPNNYTYSLRHETVEEIPIPETTPIPDRKAEYVVYQDQTHIVSKGSVGHKVRTYLVTRDSAGAVVSEKELYVDTYKAQAPVVYVGVSTRE